MKSATRVSQNNTGQGGLQARTSANKTVKHRLEESQDGTVNFFIVFGLFSPS
jgi:hypothetical protein